MTKTIIYNQNGEFVEKIINVLQEAGITTTDSSMKADLCNCITIDFKVKQWYYDKVNPNYPGLISIDQLKSMLELKNLENNDSEAEESLNPTPVKLPLGTEFKIPKECVHPVLKKLTDHFKSLIYSSISLTQESKDALFGEFKLLHYYGAHTHDKFDPDLFLKEMSELAINHWQKQNFHLVELWQKTAINASQHHANPEEVADNVVSRFLDNFTLENPI